jgi:hypothetical protein
MTLQRILNKNSLRYIPLIKKLIQEARPFEADQMEYLTINRMMNSSTPIGDMNKDELALFQNKLIETFKYKAWI